jgi:Amt family ammonium transporter
MKRHRSARLRGRMFWLAPLLLSGATPAWAQNAGIDGADTAWMLVATAIVLMMTLPGLALFYCGMVRKKNVLATMAQSFAAAAVVSLLWMIFGYGLSFTGGGAYIGGFDRIFLSGITMTSVSPFAKTIPENLFVIYQMTFAIITVALVAARSRRECAFPRSCCFRFCG